MRRFESRPEVVSVAKVLEALQLLGYEVILQPDNFVVLRPTHPGGGEPYPLVLDTSRRFVPLQDVIDQIEDAGIDLDAFNAQLESIR